MNKFAPLALLATFLTFLIAPAAVYAAKSGEQVSVAAASATSSAVKAGRTVYDVNGQRIAPAYRVTSEGVVQVIINSKLYSIPASTISDVNGKATTSLTKRDLTRSR